MMVPRSKKLPRVGFSTVSFGGYMKISEKGLNALVRVYTSGNRLKIPKKARTTNRTKSPPRLRLRLLNFLL